MSTQVSTPKPNYAYFTGQFFKPLFTSEKSNIALRVCDALVRVVALPIFGIFTLLLDGIRDAYILSGLSSKQITDESSTALSEYENNGPGANYTGAYSNKVDK